MILTPPGLFPVEERVLDLGPRRDSRVRAQRNGCRFRLMAVALAATRTETFTMGGQTTHRSFSMVGRGHYVIDANGDIKVSRDELRVECR